MSTRTYGIWHTRSSETNEITDFWVSDITAEEHERSQKLYEKLTYQEAVKYRSQEFIRPRIATFPVSELYSEEEQRNRARMLRDYLNKIQEAKERAERDTAFIDVLTAGATVSTTPTPNP
jgi:archaellum biogenesis ATPase FlaH